MLVSIRLVCAISILICPVAQGQANQLPIVDNGDSNDLIRSQSEGETLEEFLTAAMRYNPRLRIAAEGMNIGSARRQAANARLLPQLQASGNVSDNRRDALSQVQDFEGERYSLSLSQVLFDWQAFNARRNSNMEAEQLEAQYFAELAFLLSDVADKYFNVLQAVDDLALNEAEIEALSNQADQIQNQYDRQLAQITDLYQARASLAAAQSEQLSLQSNLALEQEALRSVSGIGVGSVFQLAEDVDALDVEGNIESWTRRAQDNNFTIRAQEFAVAAADARIAENRGAYLPRVSLIAQLQDSNVGFDNAPLARTDNTYVGIDLTIPLYAGGANQARVREATSQRNISRHELRQAQLETNEAVRSAYLQLRASVAQIQSAQVLVESTELAAEAMLQGFDLGVVTSVDVLNAIRDRFRAQRELQQARYDNIRFYLSLKRESGELVAADIIQIGSLLFAN